MALKVSIVITDNQTDIEIDGSLDAQAKLPDVGSVKGRLVINLAKLTFINSLGIRHWVNWIKSLRTEKGITLTQCAPPFVRQLGILHTFLPKDVSVKSICVPYYCEECSYEEQKLIIVETELSTLPSELPCVKCTGKMKLDVIKTVYFKYWEKKAE